MTKLSSREAPIKPGAPNEAPWLIAFFRSVLRVADRAGQIIAESGRTWRTPTLNYDFTLSETTGTNHEVYD